MAAPNDMSEIDETGAARKAYAQVRPSYEKLAPEIRHILETKLAEAGLIPVLTTGRIKTIDSFAAKMTRKHYANPLS